MTTSGGAAYVERLRAWRAGHPGYWPSTAQLTYLPDSNRLATHDGNTVMIDAAGNTTGDPARNVAFTYGDHDRMLEAYVGGVLQATYVYNGQGQRIKKIEATGAGRTFVFHYGLAGELIGETVYDNAGVKIEERDYIWLDALPLAQAERSFSGSTVMSDRLVYIHGDQLNTPRLATDDSGMVVWRWDSDAFGVGNAAGIGSAAPGLAIGNYQLVGSERVQGNLFDYTYAADVTNTGGDAEAVTATVTSTSPDVTVIEGGLSFGDVPAGATVTSLDTFTIRQDRRDPFDPSVLEWDFSYSAGSTPENVRLRFPGQYYDEETGLHYNYFRDYWPETGRYIESDPMGLSAGINTYGYVGNAPQTRIDPYGLQWIGRLHRIYPVRTEVNSVRAHMWNRNADYGENQFVLAITGSIEGKVIIKCEQRDECRKEERYIRQELPKFSGTVPILLKREPWNEFPLIGRLRVLPWLQRGLSAVTLERRYRNIVSSQYSNALATLICNLNPGLNNAGINEIYFGNHLSPGHLGSL